MRRAVKNTIYTLLLLTLSVSAAFLIYLRFLESRDKDLSGEWTADLNMTEQAAAKAFSWLQDIEGVSVTLEELGGYMQDLTVQVNLTFEQTARSEGTFRCNVLPESYVACNQAAYEAFAAAFRKLTAERLRMAGYGGDTDEEAVEALVLETFGMSTVSYLMSCGPALLPSLEELQSQYDGNGTYKAAEGILTRQFDVDGSDAAKTECYIRKGSSLILSEEAGPVTQAGFSDHYPVLYILNQPQSQ